MFTPPSVRERAFLRFLVYQYAHLSPMHYLQAMSLWVRIKSRVADRHYRVGMAACLNISVQFLGPQPVCRQVHIFRPTATPLFSNSDVHAFHSSLLGYPAASHLHQWQVARNFQWYIVLCLLGGRIQ